MSTVQDNLNFIEEYRKVRTAAAGSKFDVNANVTQRNIATLQCEMQKGGLIETRRGIMNKYLTQDFGPEMAQAYIDDLKHHNIYQHDETSIFPYCCAVSLYPFLLNGTKGLGGLAGPPQHASSFIGEFCNLAFIIAGQFVGAVATPEFLCYFDHFLRKDYGDDYIEHLDDVLESWGNRKRTLRKTIEDWFEQMAYSVNEPASARNFQSIFLNFGYFDKYYFESVFNDFVFPDGDEPCWESTKELQKMFMKWFNNERTRAILTFPVESANALATPEEGYKDKEMADFFAEMWAEGHSFFMYQSDSVDALSSCCRLRNEIQDNVFSYTLGAGGVETGSKCVITMNLNRIIQDWYNEGKKVTLSERIAEIEKRIHCYLQAWNHWLWDAYEDDLLPVYKAGFINLDKQYLTSGVNGFIEAAEFLGITPDPDNEDYRKFAEDVLGTIKKINKADKTEHCMYNTEFVPKIVGTVEI